MKLVMFDVDGTLCHSLQVHLEHYPAALKRVVDVKNFSMDWSVYPHVTDSFVLHHHFMESNGRAAQSAEITAFQEFFTNSLSDAFTKNPNNFGPVPGAPDFLESLRRKTGFAIAIATGGWRHPAIFKLRAAGLQVEDLPAAFADDGHSREEIMQTAYCRACEHYQRASFESVVYVGDGSHDVRASKNLAYGFIGIAESDRKGRLLSAGAKFIFPNFCDTECLMKTVAQANGSTSYTKT